jgi:osmotically-inducible protein OsmY
VVAIALLALCITADVQAGSKRVDDIQITNAIEREMWGDDAVASHLVDVTTQDGVVTFTGSVDNVLAKERAVAIAENTVGVRAIVNRIQVNPTPRSDEDVRKAVAKALLHDPAADSYELDVAVSDGIVTLTGTVDSWQERQLAALVAKGVRGVRGLRNDVSVDYKPDRLDREIKAEVEARLANDVRVDDALLTVQVEDGKVALEGTVGSLAEKNRARADARVAGVHSVDVTGVDIEWWARDTMRRKSVYTSRNDDEVEEAIKDAFLYDPRVVSFQPEVEVRKGTVTLTGTVDNLLAKRAAEQDAQNTIGVWRVENHLRVRPQKRISDRELERRIRDAFAEDPYLDRYEVNVSAFSGRVYLTGNVSTSFEKERAGFVAEGVPGVVDIENTIDFEYVWRWKSDWTIKQDIESELYWSPYVDSEDITISVEGGIVTLTGKVDTWYERQAAVENAFEGGAKDVLDKLVFSHGPES